MIEERFVMISRTEDEFRICDRENDNNLMNMDEILDCLNEQQSTICSQEQIINILKQEIGAVKAILTMLTEKLAGWDND